MRVVLITWAGDLDEKVTSLRGLAEEVETAAPKGPPELKALGADPPDAFVVDRVRAILADAHYSDWTGVATQLRTAIERPPADPIVPDTMAPYAGVPLEQKLGVTGSATVRLISPPDGFAKKIGMAGQTDGSAQLVILFVRTPDELEQELTGALNAVEEGGSIWLAWPKGGKADRGELTQPLVQQRGLAEGWVDYKVASFDDTWSGLRFKRRA
jgi:hypothetical protein